MSLAPINLPTPPPAPTVQLTLVNGSRVTIGHNIQGANAWLVIGQMLTHALNHALQELAKEQAGEEPKRIIVPSLKMGASN